MSKHRKVKKNNNKNKDDQNKNVSKKIPPLDKLIRKVKQTVIGQDDVVQRVCTRVIAARTFKSLKCNILIRGPSGTGKTEIARQIAKNINVPCIIADATVYTEEGYIGASVTDMIKDLIREADGDLESAAIGIIFIDEIDKKTSRDSYLNSDISRGGVLKSLLKLIEGTKVEVPNPDYLSDDLEWEETVKFDTSNIIFIFSGAFEGLDKIRDQRLKKNTKLGFTSAEANQICTSTYLNTSFAKEDLIEYGLPPELVGRISSIYETRELQIEDLKKILEFSKKSEFRKYEKIFKSRGIKLVYSEKLFELIASNAKKSSTGARELNSLVSHIFEKIMYDTLCNTQNGNYTKCVLDDEIVNDNSKYHWE